MAKKNLDESIAGCLGQLIVLCLIIGGFWLYFSHMEDEDHKAERNEELKYTAQFDYNVDSLGKAVNYFVPSDTNIAYQDTIPGNSVLAMGKVIVLYGEGDHEIELNINRSLNKKFVAFRHQDLSTIVFVAYKEHQVGEYNSSTEAIQNYVVLDFWNKISNKLVVRRLVWGPHPPKQVLRRKRTKGDIKGGFPSPEDIAKVIEQQITNK